MDPLIIAFTGEYDLPRQQELRGTLEPAFTAPYAVLDLSHVDYVDSACLCEFIRMRQFRSTNGLRPACFVVDSERLGRLFHFLELDEIFTVVHSLEEALEKHDDRELASTA